MRILLTLLGGVVALAAFNAVVQKGAPAGLRRAPAPRRIALPPHYNRLAAYYRVFPN